MVVDEVLYDTLVIQGIDGTIIITEEVEPIHAWNGGIGFLP